MTFIDYKAKTDYQIFVADGIAYAKKAHDYQIRARRAHSMKLSKKYRKYSAYMDKQARTNAHYANAMIVGIPHDDLTAQWAYLSFKNSINA